jgi:hypothetical protein
MLILAARSTRVSTVGTGHGLQRFVQESRPGRTDGVLEISRWRCQDKSPNHDAMSTPSGRAEHLSPLSNLWYRYPTPWRRRRQRIGTQISHCPIGYNAGQKECPQRSVVSGACTALPRRLAAGVTFNHLQQIFAFFDTCTYAW